MDQFISDVVDVSRASRGQLNLIVSSCGSGKTFFCANTLLDYFTDTLPGEVLFVTSRSLAAKQLINDYDTSEQFNICDCFLKNAWAGKDDMSYLCDKGIQVTTYDKMIKLLVTDGYDALREVKIIVLDECHAIFNDAFISNIEFLKYWLHNAIMSESHLVFGLTATPGIVYDSESIWNVPIHELCEPLYKYKAENLWIVDFKNLPEFMQNNINNGKTLIMCDSIKHNGEVLLNSIPGSKFLVSKNNRVGNESHYSPADMDYIRSSIIKNGVLPNDVNVLISTSTIREGFNLVEESDVKNIICCFTDEISIIQLIGRCRYNVDNLVVVYNTRTKASNSYIKKQNEMFLNFINNGKQDWFDTISSVVECDVNGIKYFSSDQISLRKISKHIKTVKCNRPEIASRKARGEAKKYIDSKLLVRDGMSDKQIEKRIIDVDRKQEVVDKLVEIGIYGPNTASYSFVQLTNWISEDLGYVVDRTKKRRVNGEQIRYTIFTEGK